MFISLILWSYGLSSAYESWNLINLEYGLCWQIFQYLKCKNLIIDSNTSGTFCLSENNKKWFRCYLGRYALIYYLCDAISEKVTYCGTIIIVGLDQTLCIMCAVWSGPTIFVTYEHVQKTILVAAYAVFVLQ